MTGHCNDFSAKANSSFILHITETMLKCFICVIHQNIIISYLPYYLPLIRSYKSCKHDKVLKILFVQVKHWHH
ncbi:CLUMA_CG021106, isoform A [Clunio marinus]|uniref:CLUMA_CG021106, isoform A n=1 Tax=Clunio marinus TaxID=568069 RepID=A0A1J1J709_9DIPT|nr:CLUMA_CG021106, isoform A [Clunio marinus]